MTEFVSPAALGERVLLRELNHRINNEFTSAINFVSVAASELKAPRRAFARDRAHGNSASCAAMIQGLSAGDRRTDRLPATR